MTLAAPSADLLRDIVVADPTMRQVLDSALKIAPLRADVLITGETGSGKELIARAIYQHSNRHTKRWVQVSCATLPRYLMESELFGYEKGAFSGADSAKAGLFETLDGGTVFLDEISDLDPRVQAKLLRVLDNVHYYRLGGTHKISVDVRVIAASNRDLLAAVQTGTLGRDLYHRMAEVRIQIPPLRERPQDIVALAQCFLQRCCPGTRFTPEAMGLLSQREWRGNVRELHNLILSLAISTTESQITPDDITSCTSAAAYELMPCPDTGTHSLHERQMIVHALHLCGYQLIRTASYLGMSRRVLCRKLNHYQITLGSRDLSLAQAGKRATSHHRMTLSVPVIVE